MDNVTILMSIKPKWCKRIANGDKTLEIRKSIPEKVFELPERFKPFKVYMYCTKERINGEIIRVMSPLTADLTGTPIGKVAGINKGFRNGSDILIAGTVFGEFTCTDIISFDVPYPVYQEEFVKNYGYILEESNLSFQELHQYTGNKRAYAYRISDVKLYNKPKTIYDYSLSKQGKIITLNKAPQSWCYVSTI